MEEIKAQIELLHSKINQSEQELNTLRESLKSIENQLENSLIEAHAKAAEIVKAKEMEEQAIALEKMAAEEAREKALIAEEERIRQKQEQESKTVSANQADGEIKSIQIGDAEHAAILKTIDEISSVTKSQLKRNPFENISETPSVGEKMAQLKLMDLKKGIGLNERFLFANELFNGDMIAFNRALDELNHLESMSEANKFMNDGLALKYGWKAENESVESFKSLISRRFT